MYTIQQQVHKNYKKLKYLFLSKMVRMILNSFCQECLLVSNKNEKSWTKCERGFIELTKFAVPCKIFGCNHQKVFTLKKKKKFNQILTIKFHFKQYYLIFQP
uniref:Uncharacterized protein n=1 Tax=Cacopsylla melanoneura TaxID=428564 RepID=A0A8D8VJJ0_9HEMI